MVAKQWIYHVELCFPQIDGIKKWGQQVRFGENDNFFSLNSLVFVEDLPSYESGGTRVRANHAKKMMRRKDAQSNYSLSM